MSPYQQIHDVDEIIKFIQTFIPARNNIIEDNDEQTPFMYWIQHRKDESIPDYSLHNVHTHNNIIEDNDEQTPLMYWIQCRKDESIPDYSLHNEHRRRTVTTDNDII